MGNYRIIIEGLGAHHNGEADGDADVLARAFVLSLQAHRHQIDSAAFSSGVALWSLMPFRPGYDPNDCGMPRNRSLNGDAVEKCIRNALSRIEVLDGEAITHLLVKALADAGLTRATLPNEGKGDVVLDVIKGVWPAS